jgi:RNA polymerase sigma-70 factor (ECF subfamily)
MPEKSVKTLLFRIVHNKAVNCIKHKAVLTRVHQQIEQRLSERFDSPNFYLNEELSQMLEDALQRLPDNLRQTFLLSRVEQLSYKQIAERLNITVKSVDNRLARTMKILRKELQDYLPIFLLVAGVTTLFSCI